jgi:hypothetical protein
MTANTATRSSPVLLLQCFRHWCGLKGECYRNEDAIFFLTNYDAGMYEEHQGRFSPPIRI